MLHDNYTQSIPFFKGVITKYFEEDESTGSYKAFIEMPVKEHRCPHCGNSTTYIKDYRLQTVRDLVVLGKPLIVTIRKRRYICKNCNTTFTEENPYIKRYCHFPDRLYLESIKETFYSQSFSSIAKRFGVSVTSIIRWFDKLNYPHPKLPECIAIDEFRGNSGGEKFQCNIADPVKHKVIDILPSRNTENLCKHFLEYPYKERAEVKKIIMDLSTLFRSVAKTMFPEAKIVADKFHVIRVVINSLENVRKRIQKEFHATKRKWFKRSRYLLLKPEYKLTSEDKIELARMLNSSYDLEKAYVLKERFYEVFRKQTRTEAKKELGNWLLLAADLSLPEFRHCITTFSNWKTEIANIIGERVSNGFIEGSNNKIKVLKRISYGVRNFDRFRNRILYLE
ncbi:ISL3 family transposase [Phascolarctobacterium succinatutens]|uniref:ISL3 family transposase n=1 Tax=Phascolarctobacterium succinatutens TaxID=626940 RepID=UPI0026EC5019|nr:ISL3 family transposase [Phascolarctobacterium succinatutens]